MTSTHFQRFLLESVITAQGTETGLSEDELYGLYTSWCQIHELQPEAPQALWDALGSNHIRPDNNHLGMTGPAATDYIVASAPDLI